MNSLKSSVEEKGETVTQIIHFKDGTKKTYKEIYTSSIEQSEFTRMDLKDGRRVYINTENVNCFEVFDN